jgi:hypothetical protein
MGEKAIRFGTIDDVMCAVRGRCDSHSSMREKAPFKDGMASWRDGYLRRVKTERWWLWEGFCATIIAKRLLGKKFLYFLGKIKGRRGRHLFEAPNPTRQTKNGGGQYAHLLPDN